MYSIPYYRSQQQLREGNVFTAVCQSFYSQGGVHAWFLPGGMPGSMSLLGVGVSGIVGGWDLVGGEYPPPFPDIGPRIPPPGTDIQSWPPKRTVHILLECILVITSSCQFVIFSRKKNSSDVSVRLPERKHKIQFSGVKSYRRKRDILADLTAESCVLWVSNGVDRHLDP